MRPKRLLVCSLSSHGFIFPAIGLATACAAADTLCDGHRLRVGRAGPRIGARAHSSRLDGRPSYELKTWYQPLSIAIQVKHLRRALSQFEPAADRPAAVPRPVLLAEVKKLPIAVLGMAAYLWRADPLLAERPAHTETEGLCLWRYQDMMNWYNQARQLFRMQPSNGSFWRTQLLGDVFMVRSIPELEEDIDMLPSRVHLVGPCLWEPPGTRSRGSPRGWSRPRRRTKRWCTSSTARPSMSAVLAQAGRGARRPARCGWWPR